MVAGRDCRMGRQIGPKTLGGRKVRAPRDTVVGNAHRPQGQGKCNRKYTASRAWQPVEGVGHVFNVPNSQRRQARWKRAPRVFQRAAGSAR